MYYISNLTLNFRLSRLSPNPLTPGDPVELWPSKVCFPSQAAVGVNSTWLEEHILADLSFFFLQIFFL